MTHQGHSFLSIGYRHEPRAYRLLTNDADLADQLAFSPVPEPEWGYRFEKWVPGASLERWTEKRAYALYAGQEVSIRVETQDRVHLVTALPLPGLYSTEPDLYEGSIPKSQLERFWTTETVRDLGQKRKRKGL